MIKVFRQRLILTDFWELIEAIGTLKVTADDEVNGFYALISSLALYRGTWKGTIMAGLWNTFDVTLGILWMLIPMPVRVSTWRRQVWRVKWLGFLFFWGYEQPQLPILVLPPTPVEPTTPVEHE